jgi:RNA polymerase sigma factor (sigma-70 family)
VRSTRSWTISFPAWYRLEREWANRDSGDFATNDEIVSFRPAAGYHAAMSEATFDEILARARTGDEEALTELARQYEPEVRAVARVRLGPALRPYLDTMDLVQSVHRSLLVGLRANKFAFNGPDQLIALAVTIVRRKAARYWQRAQRQQRLGPSTDDAPLPDLLMNLTSTDEDPGKTAETTDAVNRVVGLLDGLDRKLLELSLQGYKTVEIAEMLDQNADVLRVRLSRLRAKLRAIGVTESWN